MDKKKEIGNRLRKLREKKNYTQTYIAKKLGIHNSTLGKYELGEREPDNETLLKIAEIYEVSLNWILTGKDSNSSSKGIAYLGGGDDWTDEEKELARATVEAYRRKKREIDERVNK